MKVFYKTITDPMTILDEQNSTLEELALPASELRGLEETLKTSTNVLPQSARTFQDFQVGLLDRYEAHPSGMGVMDQNALNHKTPEDMELFKVNLPEGWQELYV